MRAVPLTPQRILVGVDFNQPSLAAAKWATAHFGSRAAIELTHVVPVPEMPGFLRPSMLALDDHLMASTGNPLQGLRGFASTLRAKDLTVQVRVGIPVDSLAERARTFGADLVVLGGMTAPWYRGRTLERLLRRLTVSAVVVSGPAEGRPRRILAAVDDAPIGSAVVGWGAALAERFGAELTLLHALNLMLLGHQSPSGEVRDAIGQMPRWKRCSHAWLGRLFGATMVQSSVVRTKVEVGAPGPVILHCARATQADVIVLGRNGAHAGGTGVGSATRLVLRGARVPVLVVPPGDTPPHVLRHAVAGTDQQLSHRMP